MKGSLQSLPQWAYTENTKEELMENLKIDSYSETIVLWPFFLTQTEFKLQVMQNKYNED